MFTHKLVILGSPVEHSLSPEIYQTFARYDNISLTYDKIETNLYNYLENFDKCIAQGYDGLNITMPCKIKAYQNVDYLTDRAKSISAINSIKIINRVTFGDCTDGIGMANAILKIKNWKDFFGKKVLIIGNGGAGKAIAITLNQQGADIKVLCRNPDEIKSERNIKFLSFNYKNLYEQTACASILINCTPLGMKGYANFDNFDFLDNLPSDSLVCDCVYNPVNIALLNEASKRKLMTVGGIGMLIEQAIESYYLFTGLTVSPHAIMEISKKLKERFL